jgi:peroxiredoxin
MLKTGDKAPDFTLLDQDGSEFTLSAAGATTLVYFYPG